jgi:hypothetical protein
MCKMLYPSDANFCVCLMLRSRIVVEQRNLECTFTWVPLLDSAMNTHKGVAVHLAVDYLPLQKPLN